MRLMTKQRYAIYTSTFLCTLCVFKIKLLSVLIDASTYNF